MLGIVGGVGVTYAVVVLAVSVAISVWRHHASVHLGWQVWPSLIAFIVVYFVWSILAVLLVAFFAFGRYTTRSKHLRLRLAVLPIAVRVAYFVMASLGALFWSGGKPFIAIEECGVLIVVPAAALATIWLSRRRPRLPLVDMMAWPLWEWVHSALNDRDKANKIRAKRLEEEEVAHRQDCAAAEPLESAATHTNPHGAGVAAAPTVRIGDAKGSQ